MLPELTTRTTQTTAKPQPQPATYIKPALLPVLISITSLAALYLISRAHLLGNYGTETDFYHLYAPDADRIAAGQFPENPYNGPGYPLILAIVSKLTSDVFVAGKWISITSAAMVGLLSFLLFGQLFGYWVGVAAEAIVLVSGVLPQYSISATTDVFFLMLCLLTLMILTNKRIELRWRVAIAAAIAGFTYLTRYNGVFLVVIALFGIIILDVFVQSLAKRFQLSALFVGVFLITASPWFYANYKHRGSPFYNANYLNIATEFYPELVEGNVAQEGTRHLEKIFKSFGEVVRYNPGRIVAHYPVNLYESLEKSITGELVSPWVGWFAVIGILLILIERRSREHLLIVASAAFYFSVLALTHWESRYYFFVLALYAGLAAYATFRLFELAITYGLVVHPYLIVVPLVLLIVMWTTSFASSKADLVRFLKSQPMEILEACDYLKGAGVSGVRILARKPHLAYICHQQWEFFPVVKSLDELREWLQINHVDYVIISSVEISRRRELAFLKDPKNAPPWLKPVWVKPDPTFIIYQPQIER
jgi:4-amino-4-deoxy-L-arabinose transferase-like glycosyltransferase